jgi:RNA polymerase sigma factor (sigma-70 family)
MNQLIDECGRPVRIPVNQEYKRYLAIRDGKDVENIKPVQLDAYFGEDKKNTVGSRILHSIEDEGSDQEQIDALNQCLSILNDHERLVIKYVFGLEEEEAITQLEIAEKMGTTAATVSNIKKAAIEKIRKHFNA